MLSILLNFVIMQYLLKMTNNTLNGYYQNVRGLRTKASQFFSRVTQSNYDFICLTETWLTSDFYDGEFFDPNFSVFRCDRSAVESGAARGGGAAIAVRTRRQPVRRDWPVPPRAHCDCVWVSVPLDPGHSLIVRTGNLLSI